MIKRLLAGSLLLPLALGVWGCGDDMYIASGDDPGAGPSLARSAGEGGVALATGGVGLFTQPSSFSVDVGAAASGDIMMAAFYWSGRSFSTVPDPTIVINGVEYTGTVESSFPVNSGRTTFFYKLDALAAGLVAPGLNSYTVEGFDHGAGGLTDGIALAVIYADADSEYSEILTLEPNEFLWWNDPVYPQGEVHSFSFLPADGPRTGTLVTFVGDCKSFRPDRIWYTTGAGSLPADMIGGSYDFVEDMLVAANGAELDVFTLSPIDVAAGDDFFAYQFESPIPGDGDSMLHTFAAFCVPAPPEDGETGCRVTGGGVDASGHWDGSYAEGKSGRGASVNRYTFGGQAGAPTGSQPQPYGEWTHHQQRGPAGSFVFHAGTASAPDGTEIDWIGCSDPGWCVQARPAPAKQIDFEGVGTFRHINSDAPELAGAVAGETYHWFEVHIEDLGEPGNNGRQRHPGPMCPEEGSPGGVADCDCPDFYRITIYAGVPAGESPNTVDVIYDVYGYIDGGNLQIHPSLD